jgi:exosortase
MSATHSVTARRAPLEAVFLLVVAALLVALYKRPVDEMVTVWKLIDSYYSHGWLVPLVSLFFVWRQRKQLLAEDRSSSRWGYVWIVASSGLLLLGDFLGFRVIMQVSMLPMIAGISMVLQGVPRTRLLWFPIVYLIFMIPIPPSVTQNFALHLKLVATEGAVRIANAVSMPLVQNGSFIYWINDAGEMDNLLVGEVCGGLRSLIALLAFGALMAYISQTRNWARVLILACAPVIAVAANMTRIFVLCVVGYFYGSEAAAGAVHDISGYMIFVIAFVLFFTLESLLRRWAPRHSQKQEEPVREEAP